MLPTVLGKIGGPWRVLTPLYVKTRVLSGLDDGLACAEVCHDALVDLSRKEAFQASDDLAFGPAIGGASGDVVAGWLVESHADDDGSIEGGVGVSVAASRLRRCRPRCGRVSRPEPDVRTRSARVVQYWSVTCRWVGIVDGQFRVMHQRPSSLRISASR